MVGVSRKAQNWSLEVIIAVSVFLVIFVLVSVFFYYTPQDNVRHLELSSRRVLTTLENNVLLDNSVVINEGLTDLSQMSCDDLKDLFAVAGDVCIHFEDLDGFVVEVDGRMGIGCEGIVFQNDMACGVAIE